MFTFCFKIGRTNYFLKAFLFERLFLYLLKNRKIVIGSKNLGYDLCGLEGEKHKFFMQIMLEIKTVGI